MTEASFICRFMTEHPDWEQILKNQYRIDVHHDGPYAILKYTLESDFGDPIVQEARGIIIDTDKQEVVCWPFRKFGNFQESYVDDIDWDTASVQEKVDGSIIKLWYDRREGKWQFSTNGVIRAENAPLENRGGMTFSGLIHIAENYRDIPFDRLDPDKTYIFELVSPYARIIIRYPKTMLYHLGTRNRITGVETEEDIGIIKPKRYSLHSLNDCIAAVNSLNRNAREGTADQEGFVVVDSRWHRVKIKSPEYFVIHHLSSGTLSKGSILAVLRSGTMTPDKLCECHPGFDAEIYYYAYRMAVLKRRAEEFAVYARNVYEEYQHDRKIAAGIFRQNRSFSSLGFWTIDHPDEDVEIWLKNMPASRYEKLIPDFSD